MKLDSPLQMGPLANRIAWANPFSDEPVEGSLEFQAIVQERRAAVRLLLSDNADFGARVWTHFLVNIRRFPHLKPAAHLTQALAGIPAVVVGAGPSLAEQLPKLRAMENSACILAGGAAIPLLRNAHIVPHIGALIDKETPIEWVDGERYPLLYANRVTPEAVAAWRGERLWLPDPSGLALEEWWGETTPFKGGWTVSTCLVEMARLMGCSPIYLVGVDLAYGDEKYAGIASTEKPGDRIEVEGTITQRDWLLAARWLEEIEAPLIRVGRGLPLRIATGDFTLSDPCNVSQVLEEKIRAIQPITWQWKGEELLRALEGEELLEPVWRIWEPLFSGDRQLHRALFLERVRTELQGVCRQALALP